MTSPSPAPGFQEGRGSIVGQGKILQNPEKKKQVNTGLHYAAWLSPEGILSLLGSPVPYPQPLVTFLLPPLTEPLNWGPDVTISQGVTVSIVFLSLAHTCAVSFLIDTVGLSIEDLCIQQ